MTQSYIDKIKNTRVYDVAIVSPLEKAPCISSDLNNLVLFKREDMQSVFSFKLRGAYNKIAQLTDAQRKKGVIAASAGNHAQGVALAANKLGLRADIVMPKTTPPIKVRAVRARGGNIIRYGDTYDQAYEHAHKLCVEQEQIFVHPYNDPDVIVGQGTIGMEITEQYPDGADAIFVPVGGGGLIAGVAAWVKHTSPQTKIIGVEPEDAPTLHAAMAAGRPVTLPSVGLFADGVAVREIGDVAFDVAQSRVDEVVLVTTDEICAAIKDVFDDTRALTEPAGALSVAGLKKYVERNGVVNQTLIPIISGANINFDRLTHIVERYEIGENTESLFGIVIPEIPGSFKHFCRALGDHSITEFNYRYSNQHDACVFVGIRFRHADKEKPSLVAHLSEHGYKVTDLSDNEMSKLHLRHMIGGHAPQIENERLYRFIFPERPGALLNFLESMNPDWNISLFHYRNHGAAYGRVLAGIQVPGNEIKQLHAFFDTIGYQWQEENDNPAYGMFLR